MSGAPAHVYEIFIRATPERVWDALVDPDATTQYFHGIRYESTFEPGSPYRQLLGDGSVAVDGVVEVFEPPRRLVITWRVLYDPALSEEPPSRVEWTLTPASDDGDVTRVTLRHGDLGRSPGTWARVRLGWVAILDSLKSLLETGRALPSVDTSDGAPPPDADHVAADWHRAQAIEANNAAWELLQADRDGHHDEELLRRAHAAAYHWDRAAGRTAANGARATWLLSRAWSAVGDGERALAYADATLAACAAADLADFDLAYAHEARARALAVLGDAAGAESAAALARTVAIADPEDRAIVDADLDVLDAQLAPARQT
jgi:uncharacterized protein YndB with AHSA1/START domain